MAEFPKIYLPPDPGLTEQEKMCLYALANAFNFFVSLDAKLPDDNQSFARLIDQANQMVALRVARRVNPEMWRQPDVERKTDLPEVQHVDEEPKDP